MYRKFDKKPAKTLVSKMVGKALLGGAVLGLAMTLGTTPAFADEGDFDNLTPFNRIARLPVVKDVNGNVDHVATYAKVQAAALALARYVAYNHDATVLGATVIKGADWVLGGTSADCRKNLVCNEEEIAKSIIGIPSPEPINPYDPTYLATGTVTAANTKKASVLDFCNEHYAKQALGVSDIVPGKKVVNGYSHTPTLPCKVSVWNDNEYINVDMLDPNAIFTLFFTDALFSAEMADPAFAEALTDLPPQVKAEIQAVVLHAMNEFDDKTKIVDKQYGPRYKNMDEVVDVVASSPFQSPYKHVSYTKADGSAFSEIESTAVAQAIINTMSIHGTTTEGVHSTVINEAGDTLDSILSTGSSWRSAKALPMPLPGYNNVIEACSPKYAKMAMSTGLHHVNALPCKITVKVIDKDKNGTNETLVVSYLDPHFMLNALFADITDAEKITFAPIPGNIMDDLQKVVRAALDFNLTGITLANTEGVQISYNMLP